MNRKTNPSEESTWDIAPTPQAPIDIVEEVKQEKLKSKKQIVEDKSILTHPEFDIEGLMTDFPTATELERFVYDQTGVVLNLKGRANKLKYQIAMDVLNNVEIDPKYTGSDKKKRFNNVTFFYIILKSNIMFKQICILKKWL